VGLTVGSSEANTTVALHGGFADGFLAPNEPALPSSNLVMHSPYGSGLTFFDPVPGVTPGFTSDLVLLHTFELPPGEVLSGTISMRVRAGTGNIANDSFVLGYGLSGGFVESYRRTFGNTASGDGLTGETWDTGDTALIVLDLGVLPVPPQGGGGTVSVLSEMNARRFLDFVVEDETGVDFVKLELVMAPAPSTQGDFNNDHMVDTADYIVWRAQLGSNVTPFSGADADGNGSVDGVDYNTWQSYFGTSLAGPGGGSAAAVPEPASLLLLLSITLGLGLWRNRRPA
jgi:hypothetical protein